MKKRKKLKIKKVKDIINVCEVTKLCKNREKICDPDDPMSHYWENTGEINEEGLEIFKCIYCREKIITGV